VNSGFVHTSRDLPREWYEQLTAEQRILVRVGGKETYKWVKRRPRNEVLDCRNYALHAAFRLGLHKNTDKRWSQLESAVQPPPDLFAPPVPPILVTREGEAPVYETEPPTPMPMPMPIVKPSSVSMGGRISISGLRRGGA
jgi:phage terminase large subunit GpA-like protein